MSLFKRGSPREFYLARPEQGRVEWYFCTPEEVQEIEEPPASSRYPLLVMLPDRFFFFHIPEDLQGKKRKVMHAAAELQLRHLFPAPSGGESMEVLDTGIDVLGCFRSGELDAFVQQHKPLLLRASAVTTAFLGGRAATVNTNTHFWTMHNPGDPRMLVMDNRLEYFFGDEQELEQRVRDSGLSTSPALLTVQDVIQSVAANAVPWNSFKLQLSQISEVQSGSKLVLKAAAVLFLAGMLFCGGEIYKLRSLEMERAQWQTALEEVYTGALGPDYGSDPYGLLLYRAEQSRNTHRLGVDFMEFLGRLSRAAPESLLVHGFSLGIDSGRVQASLDNYEQMERFLENLNDAEGYSFTLDQAESAGDRVEITLRVRY
ncbi:hypothetical protein [Desulfonatronospira sp.]|uniref:hypothetical protein n=1 Tax=Desulfonatronospira sp. TaxID=1962951 RepID=UPI0025BBAF28|nr:hypothetical protein [Desulfonatronospira sp.]